MSPTDGHRGTRAIQRMVEYAPSTGGLALWVQHRDLHDDAQGRAAPLVATDGLCVRYGPAFARLALPLQTGLVAHEVLHIALRHPQRLRELQQRLGDVDTRLFTTCADAIVNSALDHLQWLELPVGAVKLDQLLTATLGGAHNAEAALLEWDVERLYLALDDRPPPETARGRASREGRAGSGGQAREGGGQAGTGAGQAAQAGSTNDAAGQDARQRAYGTRAYRATSLGAGIVLDLQPGAGPTGDPEQQAEEARTWSERVQRAHAGDGAFSMLRTLVADLPRTRTPWEQVLRVQLTRSLSRKLDVSWSRPSRSYLANRGRCGPHRRMPFEPGLMPAKAAPRLVLVVDVSGSIADTLLARFSTEVASISRRLESGVTLVIGDQRVQHVQQFAPGECALAGIRFHGGGGTDFSPMLEEADRHDPDLTVVLTDLEGPAAYRPRAPVLWAVPDAFRDAVTPFGRKLVLS